MVSLHNSVGVGDAHDSPDQMLDSERSDDLDRGVSPPVNLSVSDFEIQISPEDFLSQFLLPFLEDTTSDKRAVYNWLCLNSLLKIPRVCQSTNCSSCAIGLVIPPEPSEDPFWECEDCKYRMDIRSGSFFNSIPFSIAEVLQAILCWVKEIPPSRGSKTSKHTRLYNRIYAQCIEVAEQYMKTVGFGKMVLGGENSVALVELWPHGRLPKVGLRSGRKKYSSSYIRPKVLWIADTKCIPVRYCACPLPAPKRCYEILKEVREELAKEDMVENHDEGKGHIVEYKLASSPIKEKQQRELRILKEQQELISKEEEFKQPIAEMYQTNSAQSDNGHRKLDDDEVLHPLDQEITNTLPTQSDKNKSKKDKSHSKRSAAERVEAAHIESEILKFRSKEVMDAVLEILHYHILPKSLVVVNEGGMPNICNALRSSGRYEAVVSLNDILLPDDGFCPTNSILDNIWTDASKMCQAVSVADTHVQVSSKITQSMWRHICGTTTSSAVYNILMQIGSLYAPKPK